MLCDPTKMAIFLNVFAPITKVFWAVWGTWCKTYAALDVAALVCQGAVPMENGAREDPKNGP